MTGWDGAIYPNGTAPVVYQDGLLWAAKVFLDAGYTVPPDSQLIRVGGQTYNVGTQAGWVTGLGANAVPVSPTDPAVRIYRIRRDYRQMFYQEDLRDAAEFYEIPFENVTYTNHIAPLKAQYEEDWNTWPVDRGAPYIERNGIPGFQRPPSGLYPEDLIAGNYDEPGIAGGPGSQPADQVIWTVFNDLNPAWTLGLYGSLPLGLEVQTTLWGYKRTDGLGHTYFKRYRLINKGGVDIGGGAKGSFWIDSLFLGVFTDTDLGSFSDDLLGCVPELNLGYTYNSRSIDQLFQPFNIPAPALGYAIVQGPIVQGSASDSAIFDFRWIRGKMNLGLTSYSPKFTGTGFSDPPFTRDGALRWWRWIQGYLPDPSTTPLRLYPFPPGMPQTKFPFSGDPITRTGFIDGLMTVYSGYPGDRRFTISTGPIRLAPADTQEVIYAIVGGLGADHLTSISAMKYHLRSARAAASQLFAVSVPPPQPTVKAIELDQEIVLDWGSDLQKVKNVEEFVGRGGYLFEGYNIYQLPAANSTLADAVRIATFDVVNGVANIIDEVFDYNSGLVVPTIVQHGTDSGVQRYLSIKKNFVHEPYNRPPLRNGTAYYFAVTAYNYSNRPDAAPKSLESSPTILTAKPRKPFGTALHTQHGDTLNATHSGGNSDGKVIPIIVNPLAGTGHTYEVRFDAVGNAVTWKLRNATKDTILFSGKTNQSGDRNYDIVDGGIYLQVIGPPPGMRDWAVPSGERRFTFAYSNMGFEGFNGTIGWNEPGYYFGSLPDRTVQAHQLTNVLIKLAAAGSGTAGNGLDMYGGWNENNPGPDTNFSYGYRYLRGATSPPARPEFAPYIVNPTAGYAYQDYKRGVPLSAWNIDANPPVRLAVGFLESNILQGLVDGKWWPPLNSQNGASGTTPREWLFILNAPYTGSTPDPAFQIDILGNRYPVMWWLAITRRTEASFASGDQFLIYANHANGPDDVFEYTVPAPQSSPEIKKASAEHVGVFPNPYYAGQADGAATTGRFVTFNNLPPKATIRVFNLAGHAVRTLRKDNESQFLEWDLTNEHSYIVGSGMYICYVEMPEIGTTKILKLAVIQGSQLPAVR
ncbi:MAG: hypothetical protein KF749_08840 [Bacteroidetes bacterium]|nr:hypothetical protein [Bacteroidota bacterium]